MSTWASLVARQEANVEAEVQQRLYREAVEDVLIRAHFVMGEGWTLVVRARRQHEGWDEAHERDYTALGTAELEQVVSAELYGVLGL